MAGTLKTKIALLYRSYASWMTEEWANYIPLKGEVCFCQIPAGAGVVPTEPCVMFKVGQGILQEDGSVVGPKFRELDWSAAKAADVYAWAKKENLDFDDLDATFKEKLIEYIESEIETTDTQFRLNNDADQHIWKLQKSTDKGVTWVDTGTDVNVKDIVASIAAEEARAKAAEATKVDKEITGTHGKAIIFNEADGGGAQFINTDGVESFVGVNDGGETGIAAQIYADKLVDGKWQGAKLDVYNTGIYYTVGNLSAAERKNPDNELVVKKDIKDIAGGVHFIGATSLSTGETIEHAIQRIYTEQGKVYADRKAGDLVIIKTLDSDREFICDSNKEWVELGDQGTYATKEELQAEASTRQTADTALQSNIDAEEIRAKAVEATKTDKQVIGSTAKSEIFNEGDGGGSKLTGNNDVVAYVGTHNNIGGEIGTQIYVDKANGYESTIIDVTQNGAYYTKGTIVPGVQRDVEANEIATKGNVAQKLDLMPGNEQSGGNAYNLPYYFYTVPGANKVEVHTKTRSLDGNNVYGDYSLDVNSATSSVAGLMAAADKDKLDNIDTMTQEEIDEICQ